MVGPSAGPPCAGGRPPPRGSRRGRWSTSMISPSGPRRAPDTQSLRTLFSMCTVFLYPKDRIGVPAGGTSRRVSRMRFASLRPLVATGDPARGAHVSAILSREADAGAPDRALDRVLGSRHEQRLPVRDDAVPRARRPGGARRPRRVRAREGAARSADLAASPPRCSRWRRTRRLPWWVSRRAWPCAPWYSATTPRCGAPRRRRR